jgi:exodeoxyribonuclease VII small subunit
MAKETDYRSMMAELQQLLADMQDDGLDIDAALTKYERGQKLIAELTKYLESAENKITKRTLG